MADAVPGENGFEGPQRSEGSYGRRSLVTVGSQALIYASGLLVTPLVFKVAGPAAYGEYALLLSIAGLLFGVSTLWLGYSARRYLPSARSRNERGNLFFPQFWGNMVFIFVLGIIILIAGHFLSTQRIFAQYQYIFIFSYLIFQSIYSQTADFVRSTNHIYSFNAITVSQPYIYISIVTFCFFVYKYIDVQVLLIAQIASLATVAAYGVYFTTRDLGVRLSLPSVKQIRTDVSLGAPLVLSFVLDVLLSFGDRYVIGILMDVEAVGYYAIAYTLGSVPILVSKALTVVLPVRLAQLIDSDRPDEARRTVAHLLRIYVLIALPYVVGCVVLGSRVMSLYATDAAASATIVVLPLIALASLPYGLFLLLAAVAVVEMRPSDVFRANALATLANLILNVVLLYFWRDIVVAALTSLLCYGLALVGLLRRTPSNWQSGLSIRNLGLPALASALMGLIVFLTSLTFITTLPPVLGLMLQIAIGCGAYALFSILVGAVSRSDITLWLGAFRAQRSNE